MNSKEAEHSLATTIALTLRLERNCSDIEVHSGNPVHTYPIVSGKHNGRDFTIDVKVKPDFPVRTKR